MKRLLIPAVAVVVAALVLAGCGGGGGGPSGPPLTKAQYQAKLQQIAKDVSAKLGTASSSQNATPKDIERIQTALRSFAAELKKVNPPSAIKSVHAQLASAMSQLADELPGVMDKMKNAKTPAAAISAFLNAKSIQALLKLQAAFQAKGYTLDLSGG